jgi:hypothetical protein
MRMGSGSDARRAKKWEGFLEAAPAGSHAVQMYADVDDLAASVGEFLDAGFRKGEPAILIGAAEHAPAFLAELERRGRRSDRLQADGLLTCLDAEQTLAGFMDGGTPSRERFSQIVGGAVDALSHRAPGKTVRAFGEMVDVLWQRGQEAAALALEQLWNGLANTHRFALLCGYQLDLFDIDVQTSALAQVLDAHTHPRPVADPAYLADAVDRALIETVGRAEAGAVYLQVAEQIPRTSLPRAQAVLAWLCERDRSTAEQVLSRARLHYMRLRSAAATA